MRENPDCSKCFSTGSGLPPGSLPLETTYTATAAIAVSTRINVAPTAAPLPHRDGYTRRLRDLDKAATKGALVSAVTLHVLIILLLPVREGLQAEVIKNGALFLSESP